MSKFCVFCGEKPESKNKEHIIPKWLIKLTGDPKRQAVFGIDFRHLKTTGERKLLSFSFDQLQFPACEQCNDKFASLEGRVHQYFIRLFDLDFFNAIEIDELLDWFDKVRIGLWLWSITLDEVLDDVEPKFHIEKRMGNKDRCLFIYEMENDGTKGIQFIGTNSPGFQFIPSCFSLRINNIYFFNYSFDHLFSKNIGFPYPVKISATDTPERYWSVDYARGIEKVTLPLINYKFLKASTYLYQPIIPTLTFANKSDEENFYKTKYVKENMLRESPNKGAIFYFDKSLYKLPDDEELQLYSNSQNLSSKVFPNLIAKQTLLILEGLYQIKIDEHLLTDEQREISAKNKSIILKSHRDFMKALK